MKRVLLFVCMLAAGCGGPGADLPTSPTASMASPSGPPASSGLAGGTAMPFEGAFTFASSASFNCPPACPPTVMTVASREEGTATHLGRFTATSSDVVDLATSTATGTFTFTAANGDELRATTVSRGEPLSPSNVAVINGTGRIVGGTGRFAGATGTFSYRFTQTVDVASGTATGPGTFDGSLDLNR